ncbi:MAG: metalloregulator ArsR/SmtB family transcription factor [Bacteroidota bacterium]
MMPTEAPQQLWNPPQTQLLAKTLRAMAHPVRLSIINMLQEGKKMTVTEIYTSLDADQSAISHHLGIMRDRGILRNERDGKYIYYSLAGPEYMSVLEYLKGLQKDGTYLN